MLIALDGEEWDLVALDVGIEGHTHVGVETTRPFISRVQARPVNCMRKTRSLLVYMEAAPTRPSAAPSPGRCSEINTKWPCPSRPSGHVRRAPGARRLFNAWASLPAVAHVDGRNTSDSVRRYLRVEGQQAH